MVTRLKLGDGSEQLVRHCRFSGVTMDVYGVTMLVIGQRYECFSEYATGAFVVLMAGDFLTLCNKEHIYKFGLRADLERARQMHS